MIDPSKHVRKTSSNLSKWCIIETIVLFLLYLLAPLSTAENREWRFKIAFATEIFSNSNAQKITAYISQIAFMKNVR